MFAIEIVTGSIDHGNAAWVRCVTDGEEYRAETRQEAEAEARWTFDTVGVTDGIHGVEWRVVEVQS